MSKDLIGLTLEIDGDLSEEILKRIKGLELRRYSVHIRAKDARNGGAYTPGCPKEHILSFINQHAAKYSLDNVSIRGA